MVLRGCLVFPQTSTYQAILTTDGNRSFTLLLYQDGRMRWDYTKLAADNVLIGFSRCCAHMWLCFEGAGISPALCWDHLRPYPRKAQLHP